MATTMSMYTVNKTNSFTGVIIKISCNCDSVISYLSISYNQRKWPCCCSKRLMNYSGMVVLYSIVD